jgi:formylglycine-generating enzyme required for sulfatase activity
VEDNTGGGTFGRISTLEGRVDIGTRAVSVSCSDQDKQRPAPEWCIAYLHYLKLAELQPAAPPADCQRVEVAVDGEKHCLRAEPSAVRIFKDCAACPEMVTVPAGSFMMGSPGKNGWGEVPVTIARAFAVGRFAVTYTEWEACRDGGGCTGHRAIAPEGWGRDKRPVIGVSWDAAKAYVAWLSQKTGKSYRLPSEAEREYVTRAGTTTPYWWGSSISGTQANYDNRVEHSGGVDGFWLQKTVPVDTFAPNPWGLYNVHGNIWEWTEDCANDSNVGNPGDGTARTTGDCSRRIRRGGSWQSSDPAALESASRAVEYADERVAGTGFRVVRDLD